MTANQFDLLLKRKDSDILRKYDKKSLERSDYWKALEKLKTNPGLVLFWQQERTKIFADGDSLFFDFQPVPWYLDVLGNAVIKNSKRIPCRVVIKACKDHRFYDVYGIKTGSELRKLLCEPVFDLVDEPDRKVKTQAEILRGLADTLLFLAPKLLQFPDKGLDLFHWFQLSLQVTTISKEAVDTHRVKVAAEVDWKDSAVDVDQQSISIYSFEKRKVKPVLMASKNYRDAVRRLSEVWHDAAAKSVILSAGTGSGKEELKDILVYGLRLEKPECLIQLSAPALGATSDPLEQLYKELEKRGLIDPEKHTLSPQRVVLFFDEIHHREVERLRTLLLRMMESSELATNVKRSHVQRLRTLLLRMMKCGQLATNVDRPLDCKKILYLFAASKRPDELRATCPPPDFWTRLEHTVVLLHPLDLKHKDERREVLRQYFCMFWRLAAEARTDEETVPIVKELRSDKLVGELAFEFQRSLGSPLIPLISIRVLRSITFRLFSKLVYHVRIKKPSGESLADFIKELVKSDFDGWIVEIVKELAPEIRPEGLF